MPNIRAVPDAPPRAVLYLRQSTFREESISLELQETAGRDYCARMGYVVVGVEADPGVSGRTWKRPAVQRVMDMVEGGDVDIIVLWRWSRLSRSRKDWAVAADRVDVAGGRIESATEPNDVTAAGRFARGVMTELAAFESERIGEQWREVHDRRRALGLPGGGKVPWGWMAQDGRIVPNPDQADAIPRMYEMYLAGSGDRAIAEWLEQSGYLTYTGLSTWVHGTVSQVLESPFHAGFVVHRGELLPGAHDPLIDEHTWRRFQALRRERAAARSVKTRYLLSGILTCVECGERLYGFSVRSKTKATYYGYRCKTIGTGRPHGPAMVSARIVDPLVLDWLRRVAEHVTELPEPVDADARLDAQRLARDILAIDKQIVALTEGLASGLVPEAAYKATISGLTERRSSRTEDLRRAEDRIVLAPADPQAVAASMVDAWDELPLATKREEIRLLLQRIDVDCAQRSMTIVTRFGDPVPIKL